MSIEVMTLVFKRSLGSVTRKAVLLAMADAANDDGSGVWKSAESIAGQCDVSKRTVLRTWSELEADGLIRRAGTRSVRGGEVIIWAIDCEAVRRLSRPSKPGDNLSSGQKKPDVTVSPSDSLTPSDRMSPGDNDDTDPVTLCPKPGDTVSPKPSLNHPMNRPSCARAREDVDFAFEKIWKSWSPDGRKRSKSKKLCREALARHAKKTPLGKLEAAALAFAKATEAKYHPALDRWLRDGKYENWLPASQIPPSLIPIEPDAEAIANAREVYLETGEWILPGDPPADLIKNAQETAA